MQVNGAFNCNFTFSFVNRHKDEDRYGQPHFIEFVFQLSFISRYLLLSSYL